VIRGRITRYELAPVHSGALSFCGQLRSQTGTGEMTSASSEARGMEFAGHPSGEGDPALSAVLSVATTSPLLSDLRDKRFAIEHQEVLVAHFSEVLPRVGATLQKHIARKFLVGIHKELE
jgi:hypothetical protein